MTDSSSSQSNAFYLACLNNDLKNVRKTIKPSFINQIDPSGDTALHIACSKGYIELVKLLLRYHASRTIQNKEGLTAEQVAANDEIKDLFKYKERPKSDSKHFVATTIEVEWLDSYKNAYRISYENREHMKRWLLKVPLTKLLDEIDTGYIEKIKFSSEKSKDEIKDYLKLTIEWEQPAGLISAYTSGGTGFCTVLNYDLAEIGSNFRFLSTQNLFNSGYLDNEAPKGLGEHIFAAILINHPFFKPYYRTNITTYRGMSISRDDLIQYKINDIIMTRTFLSTSHDENIAKRFIPINDNKKQAVLCIYKVINPQTSLNIEELSNLPEEKEVLIVPFTVFQIKEIEDVDTLIDEKPCSIKVIKLEECDSNLL
ncbi:unnamed protein product [Rotaria sordida]|uniref:NAD(P)(+)--arginine ADP-ribosyltransferase n=1 Tax=Rotaria sordida TaxID=392033 RepID=A0A819MWV5_9BILA|nr:unnamed protein product [Rotaria sordida]CAF3985783.1 unnamed protein product [Rotaria sordida]